MQKKFISIFIASSFLLCSWGSLAYINNQNKNDKKTSTTIKTNIEDKKQDEDKQKEKNIDSTKNKNINPSTLSTKEQDWFFKPNKDNKPATVPEDIDTLINKYSTYFLGDTSKKCIYLTFDEGYENGYTGKILDILKANNVKAAFFVTAPYIKQNEDLIKRMEKEGHLVCNHSDHHPSMAATALKGEENFKKEFTVVEDLYKDLVGKDIPKFFRPPMGKYSELSLYYTEKLGYKSIFWSFAYNDWNRNKQPDPSNAKQKILNHAHNGSIMLLHAVSKTNTEILDSVLKELKQQGYEFKTLNELPEK